MLVWLASMRPLTYKCSTFIYSFSKFEYHSNTLNITRFTKLNNMISKKKKNVLGKILRKNKPKQRK